MASLAGRARAARDALVAGDRAAFAAAVDGSFDARARMLALEPAHVEMIDVARRAGASANYTGSGGAIVAVCANELHQTAVAEALGGIGCEFALR